MGLFQIINVNVSWLKLDTDFGIITFTFTILLNMSLGTAEIVVTPSPFKLSFLLVFEWIQFLMLLRIFWVMNFYLLQCKP